MLPVSEWNRCGLCSRCCGSVSCLSQVLPGIAVKTRHRSGPRLGFRMVLGPSRRLGFPLLLFILLSRFIQVEAGKAEVSSGACDDLSARSWVQQVKKAAEAYIDDEDVCRGRHPVGCREMLTAHPGGRYCQTLGTGTLTWA